MALAWKAGWVNSPQGFESPILRHADQRKTPGRAHGVRPGVWSLFQSGLDQASAASSPSSGSGRISPPHGWAMSPYLTSNELPLTARSELREPGKVAGVSRTVVEPTVPATRAPQRRGGPGRNREALRCPRI